MSDKSEFQYPQNDRTSGKQFFWIHITAKPLSDTDTSAGPRTAPTTGQAVATFKIAAPDEFALALNHTWSKYESMTARMASVLNKWYSAWTQIQGAAKVVTKTSDSLQTYGNWFESALGKIDEGEKVYFSRIDSPLVYKESTAAEYNLSFKFSAYDYKEAVTIHEMVRKLTILSCPQKTGSQIKIKPPHLFEISSYQEGEEKDKILNLKYTAITSIQPTYSIPFVKGLALNVGLVISFVDITPLFDTTFTQGAGVTASAA